MLAIIIFVFLASLFGITYYLNNKTPVPKGCENLKEDCGACNIKSCPNRRGNDD